MKVKSAVKMAIVYHYVTTDDEESPNYRRNEDGYWERLAGGRWEILHLSGPLQKAFQDYIDGMPPFDINAFVKGERTADAPLEDGVYHMEYVSADHVRLTKKARS